MGFLRRSVDFLAPFGFLIAFGALVWSRVGRVPPGGLQPWLIAGAALILVHLILRWEDITRGVGRRQWKHGSNALVLLVVVVLILAGVNYLASRRSHRYDVTKNRRFSLSDQTKKVLSNLAEDVKVTYFQRTREFGSGADRLEEYAALSDHLEVEFVDPVQSPTKAEAFDVRGPWPILIVQRGEQRERVSNDSEEEITNALLKVTREGQKTVCVVEGQGERSTEDSSERGFSGARGALTRNLYEVQTVFLLREKAVPAECTVLVVPGPEHDLAPEALSPIREFVASGGKALVMVEPEFKESFPNLVALLEEWNIEAGSDVVVDISGMGQIFGASELAPLVVDYPYHAITRDFRVMTLFAGARSMQAAEGTVEGVTAQDIARTSEQSWAETTLTLEGALEFEEATDRLGPISLVAAATVEGEAPEAPSPADGEESEGEDEEEPKAPEGRVVAVGDADFASNSLLGFQGNQDFFLNVVAWLAEDADLISIRPKDPEDQKLEMTVQDQQNVVWIARLVLPLLFVVAGVITWWRRR